MTETTTRSECPVPECNDGLIRYVTVDVQDIGSFAVVSDMPCAVCRGAGVVFTSTDDGGDQ